MSTPMEVYYDRPDVLGLMLAAANGNYGPGQTGAMQSLYRALYGYPGNEGYDEHEVTPVERITVVALLDDLIKMGGALLASLADAHEVTPDQIVMDAGDYAEARIRARLAEEEDS